MAYVQKAMSVPMGAETMGHFFASVDNLAIAYGKRRAGLKTYKELYAMSDAALADIGIMRADIHRIAFRK